MSLPSVEVLPPPEIPPPPPPTDGVAALLARASLQFRSIRCDLLTLQGVSPWSGHQNPRPRHLLASFGLSFRFRQRTMVLNKLFVRIEGFIAPPRKSTVSSRRRTNTDHFIHLPKVLLLHVFSHLPIYDLKRV